MTVKGFTSKDICAIIKECAKNDVKYFDFGEIHIEFGRKATSNPIQTPEKANQVVSVYPAPKNNVEEAKIIEEAKIQDTANALEDELATLQISDPFEYEELMSQEALGDERRESAEETEEN